MHITKATSEIRIVRIKFSTDIAKVSFVQSLKLSYVYDDRNLPEQSMGIGTRHAVVLKKMGARWFVSSEWYLDPLEENPNLIPESVDGYAPAKVPRPGLSLGRHYNRQRAVAYANKYAGIAWGAGNNHRYNPRYLDYTGKGGDCTNFASQVIGDIKEGGGLRMSQGWRYYYPKGGSQSWVQTDAFKNFLIRSGYGTVIANGHYSDLLKPSKKYAHGAISRLMPGDLIAYVMKGDVDHFSIVVDFDDNGYPLVNSHTADRYRVPFDLGWDKHTKYILIHMKD
ncbi:amidase domain-containing protein [Paenibacillus spongiae]|uniref:Amidase domain-containing protein n=1 Tax=Paenibacillus spongiae TaxID=2909671 RepID=A0ABY5SHD6_9BACL|nr:amidase domain-containing protein [Paenibacillus spongiae]UVI33412.1 amidase domain-containing protein [Paenibacillus spongiae]